MASFVCFTGFMEGLRKDLCGSKRAAFAVGTIKNLRVQWRSYILFCLKCNVEVVPTTTDTLCLYAQLLSRTFKSVASIRNYLSGVKLLHIFAGVEYPDFQAVDIRLALKGLQRLNPHCPKQALPIMAMSCHASRLLGCLLKVTSRCSQRTRVGWSYSVACSW